MALSPEIRAAARKYGPSVNGIARQYGISGAALLAKVAQGESGGSSSAVSPAGARGIAQFMPASRQTAISKYGVDPWASADQAIHGAALHLRGLINGSTGLTGYNPGDSSYPGYILGQKVGALGKAASGGAATTGASPAPASPIVVPGAPAAGGFDPGGGADGSAVLAQLLQRPQRAAQSTPLQAPSFAAGPTLAGAVPSSSGGPAPRADISALISASQTPGGSLPASSAQEAPQVILPASATASGAAGPAHGLVPLGGSKNVGKGAFAVSGPNPGRLQPALTSFAKKVAAIDGMALTGLDGSTHLKYTVNGNVSDHYAGNATDIFQIGGKPATGARLIRAGRAALIAAGMPRAKALKAPGGLYNVVDKRGVRHQVIFGVNGPRYGGNHLDHLHISAAK